MSNPRVNQAPWLAPLAMLLLVIALAWSIGSEQVAGGSPLLWFGLASFVALRERRAPWAHTLYFPAAVLFVLWFARAATGVFLPFICAFLAAYLLDPVIDRMEGKLGRSRAIGLIALPTIVLLALALLFLIPQLAAELGALLKRAPELRDLILRNYGGWMDRLSDWGLQFDRERVGEFLLARIEALSSALGGASLGVVRGVQGLLDLLSFLVITPVISFYLLRDFDRIRDGFLEGLGNERRQGADDFLERVDRSLSGYLRGQLVVGLIVGALFFVGMMLFGFGSALVVGLCAVVFNLIPFVGSVLTLLLALSVALLDAPTGMTLLKIGGLYAVVQLLDAAVISPRVVGQSVALHPVVVMLALLLAGRFFGIVGVLLAVPAAAVLKESIRSWLPHWIELMPNWGATGKGPSSDI